MYQLFPPESKFTSSPWMGDTGLLSCLYSTIILSKHQFPHPAMLN